MTPNLATPDRRRLSQLIGRVRAISDSERSFACDEDAAQLHSGLSGEALRALVDDGLPCVDVDGLLHFEIGDLHYLGLRLGAAQGYVWALRRWTASLRLFAGRAQTAVRIAYRPELPVGDAPIAGTVFLPGGKRRVVTLKPGCVAAEGDATLRGSWPALPSAAARIVAEIARSVELYMLPDACIGDTRLARETGLSDCFTCALLIAEEWRAAGLDGRVAQGLLVTQPYSIFHAWPEVRSDGSWLPADPLTLGAMCSFGGLPATAWPAHSCVGPMVARVGEGLIGLIESDAGTVKGTYMTSVLDAV